MMSCLEKQQQNQQQAGLVEKDGIAPELIFELKWRPAGKSSKSKAGDKIIQLGIWDAPNDSSSPLDITSFRCYLWANVGLSEQDCISYVDSDGDEVPIDSQCEFLEALKFARSCAKKDQNVLLLIDSVNQENVSSPKTIDWENGEINCSKSQRFFKSNTPQFSTKNTMAPITVSTITERVSQLTLEEKLNNSTIELPTSIDTTPPPWFKNYMEMLKTDIVTEVSSKVMSNVMDILNKRSEDPSRSNSHYSSRWERHSRDPEERLHHRKTKKVTEEVELTNALLSSDLQDEHLMWKVKRIENQKRALQIKLERLEQKTRMILEKKKKRFRDGSGNSNNLEEASKKSEALEESKKSTPVRNPHYLPTETVNNSIDIKTEESMPNVSNNQPEVKLRMSCSVTGHEMLDKSNIKSTDYYSESNSDNISIISNISHTSDQDHNFEMIPMPSCIVGKTSSSVDGDSKEKISTGDNCLPRNNLNFVFYDAESDRNNNMDSPSFELLSEPASPALSIHMDEDHFHSDDKEIDTYVLSSNIEFNGEESIPKRLGSPYEVDFEGKMYKKIHNDSDTSIDVNLEKRPGGTYSYISETLPIHNIDQEEPAKMFKSDCVLESHPKQCDTNLEAKCCHASYAANTEQFFSKPKKVEMKVETPRKSHHDSQDLGNESTESAQSFSSHTISSPEINAFAFAEVHSGSSYSTHKYVFVDHNASKGLGETYSKTNSGKSQEPTKNKSTTSTKHPNEYPNKNSSCYCTDQPYGVREATSRKSAPELGLGPADPVHILPETLVTGAVHVASKAYITARKVLNKIRTQSMDEAQKMKMGW
ncbi:uncharacterized protein LOC107271222 [Cephus cinctus]|uniref:Uncharacterized protein LOC107271222 n=1 Tax=Cephus cinctus TaxID=211228 RepID=A0AAJ7C683_CEPCN|nr:uncharacterized protein LOC107271222 [Cephus cinctus]